MKLGRPSHTTILHRPWFFFFFKSVGNFLRYGRFCDVTTRHFWSKIGPNFAGLWKTQFLMKTQMENTNRRKMRSSTRWLSRFFKILGFWPLKFQKIDFFWKMIPKIQNFQNFQKTVTYVIHLLVVYQCTKFQVNSYIFDPQMEYFCLRNHTQLSRHFSNAIFVTSGGRMQKQMTPLDSWAKTSQDRYIFCPHLSIWKFDLFWPINKSLIDYVNDIGTWDVISERLPPKRSRVQPAINGFRLSRNWSCSGNFIWYLRCVPTRSFGASRARRAKRPS